MKKSPHQDSRQEVNAAPSARDSATLADGQSLADPAPDQSLTRLLEIQRDLAIQLLPCTNLRDCLDLLLESAMRLPNFDCGGIYLLEEETGGLRLISHRGLSDEFVRKAVAYPADSPQSRLVRSGKMAYAMRSEFPPEISKAIAAEGLEALAVLPMRDCGEVIASLNVSSHRYPRIELSSRMALESLVAQAEGAITSIRAREARELAERRLRLAVEGADLGTWVADIETGAFEASARAREFHGIAPDLPLTLESAMAGIHPEDRETVASAMQRAIQHGEAFSCTYRTAASDGERWLASDARIFDEGSGHFLYGIVRDITPERKSAERVLRQSEEKYRKLYESMMDAFASVNLDGIIIESNRAFQEMLGYTQDELSKLSYLDITPEKWHAPEARMAEENQFFSRGYSDLYEKEYRRKDGTVFPVELRAFLIRDSENQPAAVCAIVRDITERKQSEQTMLEWNKTLERRVAMRTEELQMSEMRFRQLADATFEGIAISEGGILVDGNSQLARIHGYELEEMIGKPVIDFVAPESRELVAGRMREGNEALYECFGLRKDGSVFPTEVHACMRTWQGKETRVTALRDLTLLKEAAAKLQTQQTQLEHAQRLGLVSEVSAGVVHQLGQPLCGMGANLAAVLAKVGACETQHCGALPIIKDINADVTRMRETVVHLRALASPGRATRVRFDFNSMVSDVLRLTHQEAVSHRVGIASALSSDLPPLEGDSVQLSQVVMNLLQNAMEASKDCPPERRSIEISSRLIDGDRIELCVRDHGRGLSPEVMAGLFAPFFTTKPDGLGMGLRLSQTIVHAHDGTIEAQNNPDGCGAVFRVVLPVNATPDYTKV